MNKKIKSIAALSLILLGITFFMLDMLKHTTQANNIIYVDPTVINGDGTSWESAFYDLQDALNAASTGDEIWVATGTYTPSVLLDSNPRSVTFQLVHGVALYGGFPTGGGDGSFSSRDPNQYPTILSGDLQGDDDGFNNNSENSFHVVIGSGTDEFTKLDGFTITGGNADDGTSFPHAFGGGIFIDSGNLIIQDILFTWNYASREGGGIFNIDSSPFITSSVFFKNFAGYRGGGLSNNTSSPTVINSQFISNTGIFGAGGMGNYYNYTLPSPIVIGTVFSENYGRGMDNDNSHPLIIDSEFSGNNGGGMYNYYSNPVISNTIFVSNTGYSGAALYITASELRLVNSTIVGNQASNNGGGIVHYTNGEDRHPTIHNTIIWGNSDSGGMDQSAQIHDDDRSPIEVSHSLIQNWMTGGTGNISDDPLFIRQPFGDDYGDLRLQPTSPAIDAGSNENCTAKDFHGIPRPIDGDQDTISVCDMGAFEFFEPSISIDDVTVYEDVANPVTATFTISLSFNAVITASLTYTTASGTAVSHTDFLPTSGDLTFSPGELAKTVSVQIFNDTIPETVEFFYLHVDSVENAFIEDDTAIGTIIDDNKVQYLPMIVKP